MQVSFISIEDAGLELIVKNDEKGMVTAAPPSLYTFVTGVTAVFAEMVYRIAENH